MGDGDAPLGQDQLHLAQTQAEDVIEPDGVADDRSREAVTGLGRGLDRHSPSWPVPLSRTKGNQAGNAVGDHEVIVVPNIEPHYQVADDLQCHRADAGGPGARRSIVSDG